MFARIALIFIALSYTVSTQAQVLTVAGGQTIRVATKHDYARIEGNFGWKPEIWSNDSMNLSLNHAVSLAGFWDKNDVYLVSWVPNVILTPKDTSGLYPYLQFGFGVALLSDDKFESEDNDPDDEGASDMGSYYQFESSLALGLVHGSWGMRAKIYHMSNAGLADPNGGMDVAEFGISYSF